MEPHYDPPASELLTISQAAGEADRSVSTLYEAAHKGRLWSRRPGRDWLTTRDALRRYLSLHGNDARSQRLRRPR
jgi:excisionase family DNA binding protein